MIGILITNRVISGLLNSAADPVKYALLKQNNRTVRCEVSTNFWIEYYNCTVYPVIIKDELLDASAKCAVIEYQAYNRHFINEDNFCNSPGCCNWEVCFIEELIDGKWERLKL